MSKRKGRVGHSLSDILYPRGRRGGKAAVARALPFLLKKGTYFLPPVRKGGGKKKRNDALNLRVWETRPDVESGEGEKEEKRERGNRASDRPLYRVAPLREEKRKGGGREGEGRPIALRFLFLHSYFYERESKHPNAYRVARWWGGEGKGKKKKGGEENREIVLPPLPLIKEKHP